MKCALINAALFMTAAPAMATIYDLDSDVAVDETITKTDAVVSANVTNNGTINIVNLEMEDVLLTNNGQINSYYFYNDNEGTLINSDTGNITAADIYNEDEHSTIINQGNIDLTRDGYTGEIYNEGSIINGATLALDENFQPALVPTGSGTIIADIDNDRALYNAGTIIGEDFNNNGYSENLGSLTAAWNYNDGFMLNSGKVTSYVIYNEGPAHNTGDTKSLSLYNYGTFQNEGNADFRFGDKQEFFDFLASIPSIAADMAAEGKTAEQVYEEAQEELKEEGFGVGIMNSGTILNGVAVSVSADGEETDLDETNKEQILNRSDVLVIGDLDDGPLEVTTPQSIEYDYSASEGTLKGDIINGRYDSLIRVASLEPMYYSPMSILSMPFQRTRGVVWNNDTVEGDIYNAGLIVNGITYNGRMERPEDLEEMPIPEISFDAVSEAVINAELIVNDNEIINGGEINATTIINNEKLSNGLIEGKYAEPAMSSPRLSVLSTLDAIHYDDDVLDDYEEYEAEPTLLGSGSITADEIYNNDIIHNAGTITGDIYNLGYAYDDEGEVDGYGYSVVALYDGTVDGSIVSKVLPEDTEEAFWEEKMGKFANVYDSEYEDYDIPTNEDEEGEEGETPTSSIDTTGMVFGSVYAASGDNTITGSVSAEKLSILPNSSLTVGDNIEVKNLFVGIDDTVDYMTVRSVTDDERIVSNCGPMTKCITISEEPEVTESRLDIGNNTATAEYANFSADSTLALTVNSEKDYGKVIAGAFNIEEGAKLEVTVLPYFSEPDKEFTLQLLAVDEDLMTVQSDDDVTPPSNEVISTGEDSGEDGDSDSEGNGFNNFSEDYIGANGEDVIANNMFEIKRIDDEGNYSFKQIKKAEEIIDPTPIPSPIPSPMPSPAPKPQYSGMAKAWLSDGPMTTPGSIDMQQLLANTAQHKSAREFKNTLIALAPNDAPVAQALATKTMSHVFSGVGAHLSKPKSGLSSGDALNGVSAWGSTYYGHAKLDDRADDAYGFDADSKGITVGADKQITPSIKLGLGLQYDKSDIDAFRADVDVETIAAFGYGEYRLNNWYVSGVAAYGRSDYDEKKYVGNSTVKANYTADLYAVQGLTGYDFITRYAEVSPNVGLRYNYIKSHGYEDSVNQRVSGDDNDVLTGVAGVKIAKNYGSFRPSAYVNFTYDMISDRDNVTVRLPNGSEYSITSKRLKQFGTEAGAALEYNCGDWTFTANYDYTGRKHFNSHMGMLTAKYSF